MKKTFLFILFLCFSTISVLAQEADLALKNGWIRAVPPVSRTSAAYLEIHNQNAESDRLIKAESPLAQTVELHNVIKKGDMMEMTPVDFIEIPANGSRQLKPGSYHIMLIGLFKPVKEGEMGEVTLTFEKSGKHTLTLPVQRGGMNGKMNHGKHDMPDMHNMHDTHGKPSDGKHSMKP